MKGLWKELATFSDTDPTELERNKTGIEGFKGEAEMFTEEIYAMEGWFRKMGMDEVGLRGLRMMLYGDEVDEEEGVLRELV